MSQEIEIPTCDTCPYWDPTTESEMSRACLRGAPTMVAAMVDQERGIALGDAAWPMCDNNFTCGDHPDYEHYIEELADRLAVAKRKKQQRDLIDEARTSKGSTKVDDEVDE